MLFKQETWVYTYLMISLFECTVKHSLQVTVLVYVLQSCKALGCCAGSSPSYLSAAPSWDLNFALHLVSGCAKIRPDLAQCEHDVESCHGSNRASMSLGYNTCKSYLSSELTPD